MPVYEYQCPECGHQAEELRAIADRDEAMHCPECAKETSHEGTTTYKFIPMERIIAGTKTHLPYYTPVLSDAMGVHPDQVAEHRKAHPDIEMTKDGRVVLRSHAEHRRVTKKLGFMDKNGFF